MRILFFALVSLFVFHANAEGENRLIQRLRSCYELSAPSDCPDENIVLYEGVKVCGCSINTVWCDDITGECDFSK